MGHVFIVGLLSARLLDQLVSLLLQDGDLALEPLRILLVSRDELLVLVLQVSVALLQLIDILALLDQLLVV